MVGTVPLQLRVTVVPPGGLGSSLWMSSVAVLSPDVDGSQRTGMLAVPPMLPAVTTREHEVPLVHGLVANANENDASPVSVIVFVLSEMPPLLVITTFCTEPPTWATGTLPKLNGD